MKTKKRKKKNIAPWILLGFLTVVAAAMIPIAIMLSMYFPFKGMWIRENSDLLDLRGVSLTIGDYKQLQQRLPECEIRWNIPIGDQRFDSAAPEITITGLREEDIPLFSLFDDLQHIHAEELTCYDTLIRLETALPDCRVDWGIHVGAQVMGTETTSLNFTGSGISAGELMEKLERFPQLDQVEYWDISATAEERRTLRESYPDIRFLWNVEVSGKTWRNDETVLSYAGETVDVAALAAAAEELPLVEALDLTGCGCTIEELLTLREAFGGALIKSELSLFGQEFTTEAEKLDFSGIEMEDTAALEQILPLMAKLTWVDMCNCGISDEEMDRLNKAYDHIRFVWEVHFSVYTLRTDATFFCASDLPKNGYVAIKMTDEQLAPLKYCEDLIALDLGHMRYTDLSFLENMPKLQYLILVEARFTDITPIGTLKDLKYLEIFMNTIDDLSPLLNCPELKHLNIGYTSGFDTSVLKQFTGLERLWFPGNTMSREEIAELEAALPNTQCHLPAGDPDGSTGAGWREADIYFEMRDIFSMHYMPGGTGMGKDE